MSEPGEQDTDLYGVQRVGAALARLEGHEGAVFAGGDVAAPGGIVLENCVEDRHALGGRQDEATDAQQAPAI